MCHGGCGRRAVPMTMAGWAPDDVPALISTTGPSSHCVHPFPDVTIRVCPSGWICQAVRAPGSKVTVAPATRDGSPPLELHVDPDISGEVFRMTLAGWQRSVSINVHGAGSLVDASESGIISALIKRMENVERSQRCFGIGMVISPRRANPGLTTRIYCSEKTTRTSWRPNTRLRSSGSSTHPRRV